MVILYILNTHTLYTVFSSEVMVILVINVFITKLMKYTFHYID